MASRSDYRKRERSWEREDRDRDRDRYHKTGRGREDGRRRSSRSRSPRRSERDRRDYDKRDYRRERGEKDHRRKEDGRDREHKRDRDERRTTLRREDEKPVSRQEVVRESLTPSQSLQVTNVPAESQTKLDRVTVDRVAVEEGEEMDVINDDDAAMAAVMGLNGFGSTKGRHVVGNQEGGVNIKKMRTWRQYMNRRGGFNRPLDKIK